MSSLIEQVEAPERAPRGDASVKRDHSVAVSQARKTAALKDASLESSALRFVPRRILAGTDIVSEGSDSAPCLIVRKGWAAPYKLLRDGRRQILDLLMDGDGIRICRDDNGRAFHSIIALTDTYVLEGTAEDLARFGALQCGDAYAEPIFADQQRRMMDRMAILGHGRAAERLASCLLDLWKRQEVRGNVDESGTCQIPIRQSDLGDAIGLTAVHVCRTLTIFRRLGLLEFANGRLTMLQPDKVAFLAGRDGERQQYEL